MVCSSTCTHSVQVKRPYNKRWAPWQARTLGPWSSARQLVEGRAAALSAREDKIAAAAQAAAEAEAAAEWTPKRDRRLGPRPCLRVDRLFDMCLDLLVEHIEDVETLYGLPSAIKVLLWSLSTAPLCRSRYDCGKSSCGCVATASRAPILQSETISALSHLRHILDFTALASLQACRRRGALLRYYTCAITRRCSWRQGCARPGL